MNVMKFITLAGFLSAFLLTLLGSADHKHATMVFGITMMIIETLFFLKC